MKLKTALKHLRPRYLLTSRTGTCALCDRKTVFVLIDAPETVRNHALCVRCGSSSRHRHVALTMVREFAHAGIRRISDFARTPSLSVYNTSTGSPVARALGKAPNIIHSEYFDDVQPGEYKDGILNQDLRSLTFETGSLDLVVSEDVFEHIPDFREAFREVHRVLKRGGAHVFSIPYAFDRRTRELFTREDGRIKLFEPIEYHGDPVRGNIPCFAHIGYDILDDLDAMGYETRIRISGYADDSRFGTFDCFTFVTRKK